MRYASLLVLSLFCVKNLVGMQSPTSLREVIANVVLDDDPSLLDQLGKQGAAKENWEWLLVEVAKKGNANQLAWFMATINIYLRLSKVAVQEAFFQSIIANKAYAVALFLDRERNRRIRNLDRCLDEAMSCAEEWLADSPCKCIFAAIQKRIQQNERRNERRRNEYLLGPRTVATEAKRRKTAANNQ